MAKLQLSDLIPQPHVLDVRSLALLRILMGVIQLYDVYSRVGNGKYDLAWYTNDGYGIDPNDIGEWTFARLVSLLPWLFERGSLTHEASHFVVFTLLSLCLLVGFQTVFVTPLVWLMVTVHQYKAMVILDRSDMLILQILLFMCLLPTAEVWSVDAALAKNKSLATPQVKSIACLCLTLQIVMMYLGCFCARVGELATGSGDWLGLVLVHYAANGGGTFMSYTADIIRTTPFLNELMSIGGFMIELVCPLLCFLFNQTYSHFFAVPLIMLHFGIGQLINVPHWIQLGCFIHVIWVPTHIWDSLTGKIATNDKKKQVQTSPLGVIKRELRNVISFSFLCLLFVTFGHSRGLITRDVANYARSCAFFNSNWDMWTAAPRAAVFTMITGVRADSDDMINLYHFIKTGEEALFFDFVDPMLNYFTHEYPTTRWEKGLADEWDSYLAITAPTMGKAMCTMVNDDMKKRGQPPLSYVEFVVHSRGIMPPYSRKRWQAASLNFELFAKAVSCDGSKLEKTKWRVYVAPCFDTHEGCPGWASAGECEKNPGFMTEGCPKSCKICTDPLEDGAAITNPEVVAATTTATPEVVATDTDVCVDTHDSCAAWATAGECNSNREFMHRGCRKSCGICQDETEASACLDSNESCAGWADAGECENNVAYMHATCRMSCKLC